MQDVGLHYWMLIGQSRFHRTIARRVCAGGLLPGQPKILEFLFAHDGCTQKEIGQGCVLDKSTVTSLLGRMMDAGLVRKDAGEDDKRTVRIRLTEKGRQKAAEVCAVFADVDAQAWQGVSPAEQEQFVRILRQIILNLEGMEDE